MTSPSPAHPCIIFSCKNSPLNSQNLQHFSGTFVAVPLLAALEGCRVFCHEGGRTKPSSNIVRSMNRGHTLAAGFCGGSSDSRGFGLKRISNGNQQRHVSSVCNRTAPHCRR